MCVCACVLCVMGKDFRMHESGRSLDHLEECSVQLSKDFIAVLQFEADVIGFHPSNILSEKWIKKIMLDIRQ